MATITPIRLRLDNASHANQEIVFSSQGRSDVTIQVDCYGGAGTISYSLSSRLTAVVAGTKQVGSWDPDALTSGSMAVGDTHTIELERTYDELRLTLAVASGSPQFRVFVFLA